MLKPYLSKVTMGGGGRQWIYEVMCVTNPASGRGANHPSTMLMEGQMMMMVAEPLEPMAPAIHASHCHQQRAAYDREGSAPKEGRARGCCYSRQMAKANRRAPRGCPANAPHSMYAIRVLPTSPYFLD